MYARMSDLYKAMFGIQKTEDENCVADTLEYACSQGA